MDFCHGSNVRDNPEVAGQRHHRIHFWAVSSGRNGLIRNAVEARSSEDRDVSASVVDVYHCIHRR